MEVWAGGRFKRVDASPCSLRIKIKSKLFLDAQRRRVGSWARPFLLNEEIHETWVHAGEVKGTREVSWKRRKEALREW